MRGELEKHRIKGDIMLEPVVHKVIFYMVAFIKGVTIQEETLLDNAGGGTLFCVNLKLALMEELVVHSFYCGILWTVLLF